ncbi:DUF6531 domain-containing protein [Frigoribacterium faeni]|uniref:RHS repeat-associated protein n=1 Tax=Frigoribacterium faeni TaxID=145483 RepID=A0A7W3JGM5_9MICO|nr:DUF6531 domain-containing protein [Frigoribacterium faeni]MBA8812496.1 RHS repeat-associated protein [Frigoribacterium faeni]GEK81787.1 hypothetical protein FFA01_00960 [Frigoribacterium faeni]
MTDPTGNEAVTFDDAAADALISEANASAEAIDGQVSSRRSYRTTAEQDFLGRFSELFASNQDTAKADGDKISAALRDVATWAGTMKESAKKENARRKRAREWTERHENRSGIEKWWDGIVGEEEMPNEPAEKEPTFPASTVATGTRDTPAPGSGGGEGGASSARPENLRSFATGSSGLDTELNGKPASLRGKLTDFASRCKWGEIDASGLVTGFEKWLEANGQDVTWATTVADAFAAAGGEGAVSTVADSALAAALQSAGVSADRTVLAIDPPRAYGEQPTTGFTMDPVNTTTGNFLEPEHDLGFAGGSASLAVTRMYNSLDENVGLFGPGWSSVLETRLLIDDEGASFVGADGRQIRFPRSGAGWARGIGENRWLAEEDGLLVVRDNEGTRIDFSPSGRWVGQRGRRGTAVRVEREGDVVTRLVHERGRFVEIEHADGRVVVLRGSDGRRVEYEYDEHGRLVGVTTAEGTRRYGWNDAGLIATVTSAAGVTEVDNTYDERGRVVLQVSPHGRRVRFGYLPGRVTVVSDEDGTRSNTWSADAKGRLVGIVDSDDRRQSMSYDAHGNLVSATQRDGSVTVHGYDDRGRRTRTVTPAGADITYGYDDLDRVTTVVTESGGVVAYEYEGDDRNPSALEDPVGGRSELTWRDGCLVRAVDATGVSLDLEHDRYGDVVAARNAEGDVVRLERDPRGQVVASVTPSGARTEYRYDEAGRLVSRRDPDGAKWRFERGPAGRLEAQVDPTGARTEYGYGPAGDLVSETDPLGRTTTRTMDDQGDVAGIELPGGAAWAFEHDALSRLRVVTDPTGARWDREYGVNGDLTSITDPTGVRRQADRDETTGLSSLRDAFTTTTLRTDEFGRPVERTSDERGHELVTYDACGRPVELVDGEGGLTRLERDLAGRVVAVTSPTGARSTYEYDACGRAAAATDATGARTTLTYDADSRVSTRTAPTGDVERLEYDLVGRVVSRTIPGAGTARYRWDAVGRLVASHDLRFGRRTFRYDAAGQMIAVANGLGGVTSYEYDERGRPVAVTDPVGGVTRRAYDAADRVIAVTDPLGRTTTYSYDAAGRPVARTDPDGRVTENGYDRAGRQQSVRVDGAVVLEIARDPFDRTVVVTDHTRGPGRAVDHELRYDRRGLLVRRSRGAQAMAWERDADGIVVARVDPAGVRTDYRRDANGRIVGATRDGVPLGGVAYDGAGRVVESIAGDLVQTWSYEGGVVVEHVETRATGVDATRIEHDADGRIAAVEGPRGRVEYRYDDAAQLVAAQRSAGAGRTWGYDTAGRLVAETADGVETRHEYDRAAQLVATERLGVRVEYVHDGLGRRIRRTEPDGSTREYLWSDLGRLGGIVDRDRDGTETGRIDVWVDGLGELAEAGGVATWWDSVATVPSLACLGGAPVLTLPGGVTAVDEAVTSSGWRAARATDVEDPWEALASASELGAGLGLPEGVGLTAGGGLTIGGLDWLGARVYDPSARGFLSTDPIVATLGAGWAANPYSYAGNDPIHALDPLGLKPATDADLKAYNDANQGFIVDAAKEVWSHREAILAGVMIAGSIALMFVPGVNILALAAGGALLAGGMNIIQQGPDSGNVDYKQVGVQMLIGGVAGAAGGAAATVASKAAPAVSQAVAPAVQRIASPIGQRVATAAVGRAGQGAVAAGVEGATSNVLDYGLDPKQDHSFAGYVGQGVNGFVAGSVTSGISSAIPAPSSTNILSDALPSLSPRWNAAGEGLLDMGQDSLVGGTSELAQYVLDPDPESTPGEAFSNGFLSGAEGPSLPRH